MKTFKQLRESMIPKGYGTDPIDRKAAMEIATYFYELDRIDRVNGKFGYQNTREGRKMLDDLKKGGWWIRSTRGQMHLVSADQRDSILLGDLV